jgi:hypothetical protein
MPCTVEGAAEDGHRKPFVGHVDPYENFVQGGMISPFIRKHGSAATGPKARFVHRTRWKRDKEIRRQDTSSSSDEKHCQLFVVADRHHVAAILCSLLTSTQ